jgi:hypothetical protein
MDAITLLISISLEQIRVNETYVIAEMNVFIIFIQNQWCKNYDLVQEAVREKL